MLVHFGGKLGVLEAFRVQMMKVAKLYLFRMPCFMQCLFFEKKELMVLRSRFGLYFLSMRLCVMRRLHHMKSSFSVHNLKYRCISPVSTAYLERAAR